jgi:hypothetical protein
MMRRSQPTVSVLSIRESPRVQLDIQDPLPRFDTDLFPDVEDEL